MMVRVMPMLSVLQVMPWLMLPLVMPMVRVLLVMFRLTAPLVMMMVAVLQVMVLGGGRCVGHYSPFGPPILLMSLVMPMMRVL